MTCERTCESMMWPRSSIVRACGGRGGAVAAVTPACPPESARWSDDACRIRPCSQPAAGRRSARVAQRIAWVTRSWPTSRLRRARSAEASSTLLLTRRLGASFGDQLVDQGDPFGHVATHHFLRAPDRLPHREEPDLPVIELQDHVVTDLD